MRGKHDGRHLRRLTLRITPAHAGKTGFLVVAAHGSKDHPRACGENDEDIRAVVAEWGSPPRMRGKRRQNPSGLPCRRITPAHAGKTIYGAIMGSVAKDHPRACGENLVPSLFLVKSQGSPPRMRGKPAFIVITFFTFRITPAHAGKTQH